MSQHELFLLSPYRLPTHHTLYLADDDVAAFLNGLAALWHPAALRDAVGPPRVASPYDHEQPRPNCIYATPDHPPLLLPDDWLAVSRPPAPSPSRPALAAMRRSTISRSASTSSPPPQPSPARGREQEGLPPPSAGEGWGGGTADPLLDLDPTRVAPFLGLGFGHGMMEALFEAMSHDNMIDAPAFWKDVQDAIVPLTPTPLPGGEG